MTLILWVNLPVILPAAWARIICQSSHRVMIQELRHQYTYVEVNLAEYEDKAAKV